MKRCPVCNIDYSDEAEFCAKCKAYLQETKEEPKVPFERKRLLTALAYTIGFMLFIAGIYYLYSLLT